MIAMPCGLHVARLVRIDPALCLTGRASACERPAGGREPARGNGRAYSWLGAAVALIWIGVLLFVIGYLTVNGEAAISDFDALDLSAYSITP
jgi:hypothetical protein